MARCLLILRPSLPIENPSYSAIAFLILVVLCVKRGFEKKEESNISSERKLLSKINSYLGNKAQLMVKLVSWRKVQAEDEGGGYITIIMGERCRPLDFSGKILYDSKGNLLPEADHSAPRDTNNNVIPSEK
ncbi:hypothetical protein ES332_A12G061200v1 [Gossypium tomentosum]|uniref:Uncharacterized protein n=1 Tax=Gossypium tomentosum TaxID=34277 RepID=A0A5D2MT58_GOSTO|nr:hypothetical protein ES332_A12G061200v1 [Gossypium tomentosum]